MKMSPTFIGQKRTCCRARTCNQYHHRTKRDKFTRKTEVRLVEGALQDAPAYANPILKYGDWQMKMAWLRPLLESKIQPTTLHSGRPVQRESKRRHRIQIRSEYSEENPREQNCQFQLALRHICGISCYMPPWSYQRGQLNRARCRRSAAVFVHVVLIYGVDIEDTIENAVTVTGIKPFNYCSWSSGAEALARQAR